MYRIATCVLAVLVSATAAMAQDRTPSTSGAVAYIISPADGDSVSNPVIVQFGLDGMGVERAGVALAIVDVGSPLEAALEAAADWRSGRKSSAWSYSGGRSSRVERRGSFPAHHSRPGGSAGQDDGGRHRLSRCLDRQC